ncbi:MAG: hypothetical protein L6V81_09870 [Clostridium sp.]|nr:MAG: hypothetical protein L6V81_09870 [Clostridium sp.]
MLTFCIEKDIRIGDYVYIYKAGDVIPAVDRVELKRRNGSEKAIYYDRKLSNVWKYFSTKKDKMVDYFFAQIFIVQQGR